MAETVPISEQVFRVFRNRIPIFTDGVRRDVIENIADNQKVVIISIGTGETKVSVLDDEGRSISSWTAVFGWSSLCDLAFSHHGRNVDLSNILLLARALGNRLRMYGDDVDASGFIHSARSHLCSGVAHIVDQTIGDGSEYDRIILAAPVWLHDALSECLLLRPHIDQKIQEL